MNLRRMVFFAASLPLAAQTKTPAGDWPMFNRDLAATRYSPLAQINAANVTQLGQVWTYRLQAAGFRFATAGGTSELTPIVVKGALYISGHLRVVGRDP